MSTSFHYLLTKLLSSPYIVIATTYIVIGTNKLNCLVLSSCVNEYMLMVMFWLLQKRDHFLAFKMIFGQRNMAVKEYYIYIYTNHKRQHLGTGWLVQLYHTTYQRWFLAWLEVL